MAVNGFAAAQDILDINTGVAELAAAMGARVGATEVTLETAVTNAEQAAIDAQEALNAANARVPTTDLSASSGAGLVGVTQGGTNTVAALLSSYLAAQPITAILYASVQDAINRANALGGGTVILPPGVINLGTTGLTMYANVILKGAAGRYGGTTSRGTTLTYSGTGTALYGVHILDSQVLDLDIDCAGAAGVGVRGVHFTGVWKTTLRNVTIRGVTPAKGYAILYDTIGLLNPFGGQHNYMEQVEVPDGTIRLQGVSEVDGVTTTVFNTIRGFKYEVLHSQGVFLNATAEGWTTGAGFSFDGLGTQVTMLGCDIEGAGDVGIQITNNATVREMGTIWAGFSGGTRVVGNMASTRIYGGAIELTGSLTANVPRLVSTAGDTNAIYISDYLVPTNTSGGDQTGYRQWRSKIDGDEFIDHDWEDHAILKKIVTVATTSPVTLMTIPMQAGSGLSIKVIARGFQPGDGWFCITRTATVLHNGAIVIDQQAAVVVGIANQLSFDADGNDLRIRWVASTANSNDVRVAVEILGDYIGHI